MKTNEAVFYFRMAIKAIGWVLFGSKSDRRRVRHACAHMAAGLFGDFPLSADYKLWRTDAEFLSDYRKVSLSPYMEDRKFLLREMARFTKNLSGVMAECGCFEGAASFFLAKERPDTALHLFDSFQGLSAVGENDKIGKSEIFAWQPGDLTASEEVLRNRLREFTKVVIHKGWIPQRFCEVENERFSLVHIDVDLYQPTLDSMKFFYPRMQPGGAIILDDYGYTTCPGAYRAVHEFMADKPQYVLHIPTGQGLIII